MTEILHGPTEIETASTDVPSGGPPSRPSRRQERLSQWLYLALSPRMPSLDLSEPPADYAPFEHLQVPRSQGSGTLSATLYRAGTSARGTVLLLHPWHARGRTWFYRHGRIPALREAGFQVLTVDLPGFGDSGPAAGYFDRDVEDALAHLRSLFPDLPVHLWGVSFGGVWSHMALSRGAQAESAVFEDVSPHLLEWSWRVAPLGRPFYLFFRTVFRDAYRFFDGRLHAPYLQVQRALYISGSKDRGVQPTDTKTLASNAGADYRITDGANHLKSMKVDRAGVLGAVLKTLGARQAIS